MQTRKGLQIHSGVVPLVFFLTVFFTWLPLMWFHPHCHPQVEFTLNDGLPEALDTVYGGVTHPRRRHFERILRKVLALPQRPALVLLHTFDYSHRRARRQPEALNPLKPYNPWTPCTSDAPCLPAALRWGLAQGHDHVVGTSPQWASGVRSITDARACPAAGCSCTAGRTRSMSCPNTTACRRCP